MGDMGEMFRDLKEHNKRRRQKNLSNNEKKLGSGRWIQYTAYHYGTTLLGHRLDFWPSKNKWQWRGRIHTGDVFKFIEKQENGA